jgi:urease accessory protein
LIVGVFAVFHGLAHGYELTGAPSAWAMLSGMLAATALLHLAGVGAGWALRNASVWLPRAAGAAVALFGLALLARLA